jgi:pSer/pThr/pTyr-binding forkhead associated (FHA) protein
VASALGGGLSAGRFKAEVVMRVELTSVENPQRIIAVEELPALIGRDISAEVCLNDSWVGHYQCILEREGRALMVLDLGTRTGTFVNGKRVKKARIMPGDRLTVGRSEFLVSYEISPAPMQASASQAALGAR